VLTHCNAGWLATVDWGTALAPIFRAHDDGVAVHVWVDETRPRNQGASLTAWELGQHGVPHTVIVDNAGGHLMQHGKVDLCITGTDRTTARGDVANKIGTYLKALAARDNGVPFYVALPSPTIDWTVEDGVREIPIEERHGSEVSEISGRLANGEIATVRLIPEGSAVANYAFDVTPARLVTGSSPSAASAPPRPTGCSRSFPSGAAGGPGHEPQRHHRDRSYPPRGARSRCRAHGLDAARLHLEPARQASRPRHRQLLHHVPRDYIELFGIVGSERVSPEYTAFLVAREGAMKLAWATDDAAAAAAAMARLGLHPDAPRELGRQLELPKARWCRASRSSRCRMGRHRPCRASSASR